jgi:hypothetical protein
VINRILYKDEYKLEGRLFAALQVRMIGTVLGILSIILAGSQLSSTSIISIFPEISGILILASLLRIGVIPIQPSVSPQDSTRLGLETISQLILVAPSIVVMNRLASSSFEGGYASGIMILSLILVCISSIHWISYTKKLQGRKYWILGLFSFCIIAALQSEPESTQIWGTSLLFSGTILSLSSVMNKGFKWLPFLGLLGLLPLPLMPNILGLSLLSGENLFISLVISIVWALYIFGYLKFLILDYQSVEPVEGFDRITKPAVIVILVMVYYWIIVSIGGFQVIINPLVTNNWWVGIIICGLVIGFRLIELIGFPARLIKYSEPILQILSFNWLERMLEWIFETISVSLTLIAKILEGRGGVLWSLLITISLITMFISHFLQG